MALPKQVQAQVQRATDAHAALVAPPPEKTEAPAAPAPGASAAPSPAAAAPDVASLQEELSRLQHSHRVLQGKYNAEVGTPEIRQKLKTRVDELEATVKELQEKAKTASLAPATTGAVQATDLMALLTEDEKATFGDKAVSIMGRIVEQIVTTRVPQLAQPLVDASVKPVKDQVSEERERRARQSREGYWAELDKGCPDWETLNKKPEFLQWLNGKDPATGEFRGQIVHNADQTLDSVMVLEVFNAFKDGREIGAPKSTGNTPGTKPEQISPGPGRSSELPGSKKIWKQSEIKAYYAKRATDPVFRNSQDAAEQEADIFAAQQENRVIQG